MGFFGGSSYTNKQKKTFWLHSTKGRGGVTLYYFSTDPRDAVPMPAGYIVVESKRTGLPVLRKFKK